VPPLAANDASLVGSERVTAFGSVTVRPLEFDDRSIPAGDWELDVAWAVLGPGTSLPLAEDGERAVAHVISGSASHVLPDRQIDGPQDALSNNGNKPALALVLRIRPAHRA
jgi:hypothetical protein